MEGRSGDFESKSDECHDDPDQEQRLDGSRRQFLSDRVQPRCAAHAVDEAQAKKREGAGGAAEEKIFETCFRGARVGFVESRHDVERETGQFEPDKDHEQFLTADEEHQPNRGEQEQREEFPAMPGRAVASEEDGEKGERQADDLEERRERRDDQHPVEKRRPFRQQEDGRRGKKDPGGGDCDADSGSAPACESEGENSKSCQRDGRFGRREMKEVEIIHPVGVVESL